MSTVYEMFGTNREAEEKGVWLDYGPFRFLVARAGGANKRFQKLLERRLEPHQRAIQAKMMDEKLAEKILAECFAEAVILGWDNIPDKMTGEKIPFSKAACVELLLELPDLFTELREQASSAVNYRQAAREADAQD